VALSDADPQTPQPLLRLIPEPAATMAQTAYAAIRARILTIELPPGSVLDERALAASLGISRAPVREALIRLAAEKLVATLANRTTIVSSFDFTDVAAFLDAQELVYRVVARQAAVRASAADVARLRADHAAADVTDHVVDFIEANRSFHLAVAEIAGNAYYLEWLRQLLDRGQILMGLTIEHLRPAEDDDADPHGELIDAIAAGDPDAAEAVAARDASYMAKALAAHVGTRSNFGRAASHGSVARTLP
jgi:DNA-binding GntR family transcriptional regulator